MPNEKISKNVAEFLLAKVQEILDEKNGNQSLTEQEQNVLLHAGNSIENLLKVNYEPVSFDILSGKVFFTEALRGEMLDKDSMVSTLDEPDHKIWRVMWQDHKSPCFYVEANFDFGSRMWNYSAHTYYSKKPTNLGNTRTGWKRTPVSEIHSYNSPLEYAQKIAYAVMQSNAK